MGQVGKMYVRGKGVEKSGAKAIKWFSRAAFRGHVQAIYAEAKIYEEGTIAEPNDLMAYFRSLRAHLSQASLDCY